MDQESFLHYMRAFGEVKRLSEDPGVREPGHSDYRRLLDALRTLAEGALEEVERLLEGKPGDPTLEEERDALHVVIRDCKLGRLPQSHPAIVRRAKIRQGARFN